MIKIEEHRNTLNLLGEEMLDLSIQQFVNSYNTFVNFDLDLAEEVILKEARMNALDLKIERDTDRFIALFNPVATDLRFALALLKIIYNLERIGDQACDIANHTINLNEQITQPILNQLQFEKVFDTLSSMFKDLEAAYKEEDLKAARKIFKKDKIINEINDRAFDLVAQEISNNKKLIKQYLMALIVLKKFEKIGDLMKNVSENIIFYVEAKIIKHSKKK